MTLAGGSLANEPHSDQANENRGCEQQGGSRLAAGWHCSALDAAESDALDDLPRGDEVDEHDGRDGDHGSCHLQIEI